MSVEKIMTDVVTAELREEKMDKRDAAIAAGMDGLVEHLREFEGVDLRHARLWFTRPVEEVHRQINAMHLRNVARGVSITPQRLLAAIKDYTGEWEIDEDVLASKSKLLEFFEEYYSVDEDDPAPLGSMISDCLMNYGLRLSTR